MAQTWDRPPGTRPSQRQGLAGFHISLAPCPQALAEALRRKVIPAVPLPEGARMSPAPPGTGCWEVSAPLAAVATLALGD